MTETETCTECNTAINLWDKSELITNRVVCVNCAVKLFEKELDNKLNNIPDGVVNFQAGKVIYTHTAMEKYNKMLSTEWDNYKVSQKVCWHYLGKTDEIEAFDVFDFKIYSNLLRDHYKQDKLGIAKSIGALVIKKRLWYGIILQTVDETDPIDPYAFLLAGVKTTGYVYWFEREEMRDMFYGVISGTDTLEIIDERTDKNNPLQINSVCACDGKCLPRPMMGRSWWKRIGYSTPCVCAENKRRELDRIADEKALREIEEAKAREAERQRLEEELIKQEEAERKQQRKASPPKKEECPLSPAELKAIPPRPPAKLRSPAGSLIDNTKKQQQWDAKYSIYRKWLK